MNTLDTDLIQGIVDAVEENIRAGATVPQRIVDSYNDLVKSCSELMIPKDWFTVPDEGDPYILKGVFLSRAKGALNRAKSQIHTAPLRSAPLKSNF